MGRQHYGQRPHCGGLFSVPAKTLDGQRWSQNAVGFVSVENNYWQCWRNIEVPPHLTKDFSNLLNHLNGKAPLNSNKADQRGWGSSPGKYTIAQGYKQLAQKPYALPDPRPWQGIWSHPRIPKIDVFYWLLAHHRILTEDRLWKRGFSGPSRCSLCGNDEETAAHLMLSCNFTMALWKEALSPLNAEVITPTHCSDLFANWAYRYPGGTQNQQIKRAWIVMPKIICWHIWLERNNRIFNEKRVILQ